jgi:hypothetical protein
MTSWEEVLREIKAELLRCCQKLGAREILPNAIRARLDKSYFQRWESVLQKVTAEVGEALVQWAELRGSRWYEDCGPHIDVMLVTGESGIAVVFSNKESSATTVAAVIEESG